MPRATSTPTLPWPSRGALPARSRIGSAPKGVRQGAREGRPIRLALIPGQAGAGAWLGGQLGTRTHLWLCAGKTTSAHANASPSSLLLGFRATRRATCRPTIHGSGLRFRSVSRQKARSRQPHRRLGDAASSPCASAVGRVSFELKSVLPAHRSVCSDRRWQMSAVLRRQVGRAAVVAVGPVLTLWAPGLGPRRLAHQPGGRRPVRGGFEQRRIAAVRGRLDLGEPRRRNLRRAAGPRRAGDRRHRVRPGRGPVRDHGTGGVAGERRTPVPSGQLPCGDISPTVGITSTPVIDPATNRVFVVADNLTGSTIQHELYPFNLTDGSAVAGFSIDVEPPGDVPADQLQRPLLALDNGVIIIGYGSNDGDCGTYHGWRRRFRGGWSRPDLRRGRRRERRRHLGGGQRPAIDSSGNVWVATGNGDSGSTYCYQESVLELDAGMNLLDHWAPSDWQSLDSTDVDIGSSEPVLFRAAWYSRSASRGSDTCSLRRVWAGPASLRVTRRRSAAGAGEAPSSIQASCASRAQTASTRWP